MSYLGNAKTVCRIWVLPRLSVIFEIRQDCLRSLASFQDYQLLKMVILLPAQKPNTVEIQWLKHLWNHENMFKTGVVVVVVLLFYVHG